MKEAERQKFVPRNTNCIRGWLNWVSMHSNAKPKAQEGLISRCSGHKRKEGMLTEGGLLGYEFSHKEKSAEVIVLGATRCH